MFSRKLLLVDLIKLSEIGGMTFMNALFGSLFLQILLIKLIWKSFKQVVQAVPACIDLNLIIWVAAIKQ